MDFTATKDAPEAIGPYSQATAFADLVFTSGQIALLPDGSFADQTIEAQTRQVLKNLSNVLAASKASLQTVLKTTIFLADIGDFAVVNTIYEEFFGAHKPARSTVAVKQLPKNALIEIEAIALRNIHEDSYPRL